jgi:hypothetical protein
MHATKPRCRSVRFSVADPIPVSKALGGLGIDHHCTGPRAHDQPALMTAYYDTAEQAETLLIYLVRHALAHDKVRWQQDQAHREIEGWCELCQVANGDECDGGCLINDKIKNPPDVLFLRAVKAKS